MNSIKQNLIKELKYAQSIHKKVVVLALSKKDKQRNNRIVGQKQMVIDSIEGKGKPSQTIIRILKRWINSHKKAIDYIIWYKNYEPDQYKEEIAKYGSVSWQKRWIKVYQNVIDLLENKK